MYDQLETYLDERKLLYDLQSGFRPKCSTDTCLIHLMDFIKFQMDKGNAVGMVLLDIQKAFDKVDNSILLAKLEAIGLSNDIVKWFRSCLSGRQQLVNVAGTFSSCENITYGVPQRSILGSLLSILETLSGESIVNSILQRANARLKFLYRKQIYFNFHTKNF